MIVRVQVEVESDDGVHVAARSGREELVVQVEDYEQNSLRVKAAVNSLADEARDSVLEQIATMDAQVRDSSRGGRSSTGGRRRR